MNASVTTSAGHRLARRKRGLLSGAGASALTLALLLPAPALAETYTVNSEAELANAIAAANAGTDPSARIVLGSSFSVSSTAIPLPTKPIEIDTAGFVLSGSSSIVSLTGPFDTGSLTLTGSYVGNSGASPGTALGFTSHTSSGPIGTITNNGMITGGSQIVSGQNAPLGVSLSGRLTFVNNGTITGGSTVNFSGSVLNNGAGVSMTGSNAIVWNTPSGLIQGGSSQGDGAGMGVYSNNLPGGATFITNEGTIRGGSDVSGVFAGGAAIQGRGSGQATITNSGLLEGGNGAAAVSTNGTDPWQVTLINSGTIRAGAGSDTAIQFGSGPTSRALLDLRAGSVIQGNVVNGGNNAIGILQLGGDIDAAFDMSAIGASAQYRGMTHFWKVGTSTWSLTGASTQLLGWTIDQGTLRIASDDDVTFGTIINNGVIQFDGAGTVTTGGVIGTGLVVQSGNGTTFLGGNNNGYSGGTLITGGVLVGNVDSVLGSPVGGLTIDGGTLRLMGTSSSTATRSVTLGANGGTFDIVANTYTISNALTGGGTLTKSGGGTLALLGDNTFDGAVINAGTLAVGTTIGATGSIVGNVLNNGAIVFSRSTDWTYGGTITGAGSFTKNGTGTMTLTGTSAYAGATSLNSGGKVVLANGRIVGTASVAINGTGTAIVVDGADAQLVATGQAALGGSGAGATLTVQNGGSVSIGNLAMGDGLNQTGTINVLGGGSSLTTNGTFSTARIGTASINVLGGGVMTSTNNSILIGGQSTISTGARASVTVSGAGSRWTVNGALNARRGTITVADGGVLTADTAVIGFELGTGISRPDMDAVVTGAGSRFETLGVLAITTSAANSSRGSLTIADGAVVSAGGGLSMGPGQTVLNIGGAAPAAAGRLETASVTTEATSRINFNHTDSAYAFDALISGAGVVNQMSGTTVLSARNSYTGATTISGGTLRINGNQSDATGLTSVLSGGRLGGSGVIGGDVFVDNGGTVAPGNSPGTLAINGNLVLSGGSLLDFEFGQADFAGGPLNDLISVQGDLTLDGTINVTLTSGGTFGPGLYRVIGYGGTLIDNGLDLGTMPGSSSVSLQTSVANQINLVNSAGANVTFWDGASGPKLDGVVNGGNGVWQANAGNDNWTDTTGTFNAGYTDDSFAIFAGNAGRVTVDNSQGAVTASGLQFATGGYTIVGDAITLTGLSAVIRVGDGTSALEGSVATIAANMNGAGDLVKADRGRLVLTGTNTFAGDGEAEAGDLVIQAGGSLTNANGAVGRDTGDRARIFVTGTNGAGDTSTWTSNGYLRVGGLGRGELTVEAGGTLNATDIVYIGDDSSGWGQVDVKGQDAGGRASSLNTTADISVGEFGTGFLNVTGGGSVTSVGGFIGSNAGATGTVNVNGSGAASTWTMTGDLVVGSEGAGMLTISDGGKVSNASSLIGRDAGGTGAVWVAGTGATWENTGRINLGLFGTGDLRVERGGQVSSFEGIVGSSSQGYVVVSDADSLWINTGQFVVGSYGSGTLRIENGGGVSSGQVYVGAQANGEAVVTGAGSTWLVDPAQTMTLGNYGAGSLTIENGGRVRAARGLLIGMAAGGSGTLVLQGTAADRAVLETGSIRGGLGVAQITLDGGLLRATRDNTSFFTNFGTYDVTLGANGGVIDTDGYGIGIAPRFVGTGDLIKAGTGTLILTGNNAYGGTTTVQAGKLTINGDQSLATGATTVLSDATLAGSGIVGGDVTIADGATLAPGNSPGTLTINGSLSLSGGSILDYEFGEAGVAGGALNDLVDVGGDLTLDGTLNVAVSAGGTFGPGIYRVFNYGGTLTDNGLSLGTMPAGSTVSVQTAVSGQVNLVNTATLTLRFWDGQAGPKNDGAIGGGNGTWRLAGTDDAWTEETGALNADYSQNAFAVFTGAAGTVAVDNVGGAVEAAGLQFASDGYLLTGDALTLTGAQAIVQVGDGSLAGAGYVATIATELAGMAGLLKTDAGTLVLSGANTYTGGTTVGGGTLRISGDANLGAAAGLLTLDRGALETTASFTSARAVTLASNAAVRTDAGTALTLNGVVDGPGALTKDGAGTLVLTNANTYAGGTTIAAGTLQIGDGATTGAILGNVTNNGALAFARSDLVTFAGAITGSGSLAQLGGGTLVLTATNTYTGGTTIAGGTLRIGNGGTAGSIMGDVVNEGTLAFDRSDAVAFAGVVSGSGGLVKDGAGTLTLTGTNSYAGGTAVNAGTLLVNGDQSAATGLLAVASGAALGGTGTIGGNVMLADGALLTPGAGAPGTLTIGGDLTLAGGSRLAFEFGQADTAGGALNDLVDVGGDLTLGGTLDVTVAAGGAFGAGVYRVFNYGGTLIDNGLALGAMPADSDVAVQLSIAGQVNLVNSRQPLNFWDGAAGAKGDGTIAGGNGTWQGGAGNDLWTEANGAVNGAYADGAFAVFGGTGGTVTVDNGLGQVAASGMQFAANGYTVTGGAIALTDPASIIRVGDGTTAGAAFTATIDAPLTGAVQVVKTDAGTLVLGGANTYTSGTLVNGGTVQVSTDANLGAAAGAVTLDSGRLATSANLASGRDMVLAGAGTVSTAAATTFTYTGLLSGTGSLTKAGAGTWLVSGNNAGYSAQVQVAAGTLELNGVLGGTVDVLSGGRLAGTGRAGALISRAGGVVAPGRSGQAGFGTFTVDGDYTGAGGVLEIEAELGGDGSLADRVVVNGATSGNTRVAVLNRGGLGAQTVEGIKIVDVAGASNGTFALDGDYVFDGEQAVVAGAYGYRLYKGGVSTPTDGDWYLRSALLGGAGQPQGPLFQPGVPLYESYGQTLQVLGSLPTMQERVGNREWAQTPSGETLAGVGSGIWGRIEGTRFRPDARVSTTGSDTSVNSWKAQIGFDQTLAAGPGSVFVAGLNAQYGKADASVRSVFGSGSIDTKGYGLGATLTWFGPHGFYADGQAQLTWFDSALKSAVLGTLVDGNDGKGRALSLELGKRTTIGEGLTVTPQVQMVYQNVTFDSFADPFDAAVSARKGDSLKTRWGLSLDSTRQWQTGSATRSSHVYGIVNLSYEWLDGTRVDVSGTPVVNANQRLWGEVALGGSLGLSERLTLYTQVSGTTSIRDFGDGYRLKGTAGIRLAF